MRAKPSSRRAASALLAALVVAPLVACATIPGSGPVREGLAQLDQYERGVLFDPNGPLIGASQEDIVRGFIIAASSSENDYEIAREFLAPDYAAEWDASAGVLIDNGTQQYEISEDGIATVTLRVRASVDARGKLHPEAPGHETTVQFELAQVDNEWRIARAPDGIILDDSTFQATRTPRALYFLSGDERLVPDTRWFLNRPTLTTQLVRELMNGPTEEMETVMRTAFPAGVDLVSGSVLITDDTASIDLTAGLFDADEAQIELIKKQLAASLHGVSNVLRFELLVHGTVVDGGPVENAEQALPGDVTVLKGGEFGVLSTGSVRPIEGLSERVVQLQPAAVTVDLERAGAAVLQAGGVSWVNENDTISIYPGSGLLEPSLDSRGYVWVYNPALPAEITVALPGDSTLQLEMPGLEGRAPVAVRVSMGGNRLAVLTEEQGETVVLVAGIVRDEQGAPIGLTGVATPQLWAQGAPVDLDWIDDTRFAVLSKAGLLGSSSQVTIGVVDQFSSESGMVAGGIAISGGGSRASLRVLDDQRSLHRPQGASGWQLQQGDVELLAKVG